MEEVRIKDLKNGHLSILMIEDNPDDVELAAMTLKKSGLSYLLRAISTGEELKTEDLSAYDMVLCDYNLPDYDGLRSVKLIREQTDVPIVIVTGSISEEMRFDLLEAGADEFLQKAHLKGLPVLIRKAMVYNNLRQRATENFRITQEQTQMFDNLFYGLDNPVFIKNSIGQYERVNAAFCSLYERSEADIIGKTDAELNWRQQSDQFIQSDFYILEKGICSNYEMVHLTDSGEQIWLQIFKSPIVIDGKATGMLGHVRNITHQKTVQATMEKSKYLLHQAEELTNAGSFEYDVDLDMVTCSGNLIKMLGLKSNKISLSRLVQLIKKEDRTIFLDGITTSIETKKEYRMEHRFMLSEEKQGYFEILFRPDYKDETGNTFYGIIVDLTEDACESITRMDYHENANTEIARELHDNLGQKLSAMSMYLNQASGCNACETTVKMTTEVLHDSIDDLGKMLTQISVKHIDDISLRYAMEKVAACVPETMCLTLDWEVDESILSQFVKRQVFRVIQESVNNAVKYSEAQNINIKVSQEKSVLSLEMVDDGRGFDLSTSNSGYGLKNITHRVRKSNGLVDIHSEIGKGTRISAKIPVS